MERKRIDLRVLPLGQQILIALAVIAAVGALAWWVGRDEPIPIWIGGKLIPTLGWIVLVLAACGLAARFLARKK